MSAAIPKRGRRVGAAAREEAHVHHILTPEGVPLQFAIASAGDRVLAFLLDMLVITAVALVIGLLGRFAWGGEGLSGWLGALVLLLLFGLRCFYFIAFEMRWQGATPGKRKLGLRVIDRQGGPLKGEAIFARNLMREVEVFLPIAALVAPEQIWPNASGLFYIVVTAWFLVLACMPLFNRKRLRVGDLVGGTIVVHSPKALLLPDLAEVRPARVTPAATRYLFTPEQLELYGNYELQVLEEVLRGSDPIRLEIVSRAICEKIGWRELPLTDAVAFLHAFYAAQRARLEQKLLLGKRQDFKKGR